MTVFASPAATRTVAVIQVHQQQSLAHSDRGICAPATAPQSHTLLRQDQRQFVFKFPRFFKRRVGIFRLRYCAQRRQPSFVKSSAHRVTSSAGPPATTPRSRGYPYFSGRLRAALYIDGSVNRSRGSVRRRTRHGPTKSNSQVREQSLGDGPTSRGRLRHVRRSETACVSQYSVYKTPAMCAAHADRQRRASRTMTSTSTAVTAPAPRGPSRLAQRFRPIPGVDYGSFRPREYPHDKSGLVESRTPFSKAP